MNLVVRHARTREVLARAERTARRLGSGYVGPAHMLLALVEDEGAPAARALLGMGVPVRELRSSLERFIAAEPANADALAQPRLPYTSRLVRALRRAAAGPRQASGGGQGSPEDVLLSILEDSEGPEAGPAAAALEPLGITRERVASALRAPDGRA